MDSCFSLIGARQHCVAKICNASHKKQNSGAGFQTVVVNLGLISKGLGSSVLILREWLDHWSTSLVHNVTSTVWDKEHGLLK